MQINILIGSLGISLIIVYGYLFLKKVDRFLSRENATTLLYKQCKRLEAENEELKTLLKKQQGEIHYDA